MRKRRKKICILLKKTSFLLSVGTILFICNVSKTNAQTYPFRFGVFGGVNFSEPSVSSPFRVITGTNQQTTKAYKKLFENKYEWHVGGVAEYFFVPYLGIVFEPSFFKKSFQYSNAYNWNGGGTSTYTFDNTLVHIDNAFLLRYYMFKGRVKPFIHAGGNIGLPIKSYKNGKWQYGIRRKQSL